MDRVSTYQTLLCGAMMPELKRWHQSTRWGIDHHHWLEWARSLIERHGRMLARTNTPAMVLAPSMKLCHHLHERWVVSSYQFYPQLHLAIQPILRETFWREQQHFLPGRFHTELLLEGKPVVIRSSSLRSRSLIKDGSVVERGAVVQYSAGSLPVQSQARSASMDFQGAATVIESGSVAERGVVAQYSVGVLQARSTSMDPRRVAMASQVPLQLVFQRLHHVDEFIQVHRRGETTQERVHRLVSRVLRQTQRVEEKIAKTPVVIARQTKAFMTHQVDEKSVIMEPTSVGIQTTSEMGRNPWMPNTSQSAAVNVEELANQVIQRIDRRITAWRERMGKI